MSSEETPPPLPGLDGTVVCYPPGINSRLPKQIQPSWALQILCPIWTPLGLL